MEDTNTKTNNLQLPLGVVSKVDVGRLLREIDALDNFLHAAEVRQPGTPLQLPKTSKLFGEFLEINKLNALVADDRKNMRDYMKRVRENAPVIHMSFSADPSPLFTKRLVTWLRQNINANILLQVGLQPTIGAGAVVRTTNKYFDLSLRQRFDDNKEILMVTMKRALDGVSKKDATIAAPEVTHEDARKQLETQGAES